MTAGFHPDLDKFGPVVGSAELHLARPAALAAYLASGDHTDAHLVECRRRDSDGKETVVFEVRAERPQRLEAPILRWERLAAVFTADGHRHPALLAVREDFPDTPHQNAVPPGHMPSPCVDDRPWPEAKATWTPLSYVERIRWWLGAAARGALADEAQAIDPLFVASGPDIAVPRSFLEPGAPPGTMVLSAGAPSASGHTKLYHLRRGIPTAADGTGTLRVVPVRLPPQTARSVRTAPRDLAELAAALDGCGLDLVGALRAAALEILHPPHAHAALVALLVVAPIARREAGAVVAEDAKAFGIPIGLGELGERLGALHKNPDCDDPPRPGQSPYGRSMAPAPPDGLERIAVQALPVHLELDRDLARACSGTPAVDAREVVLVGAGAVGSHLGAFLSREGRFRWAVVDGDVLLPHNPVRHVLRRGDVGAPKAEALALELAAVLGEPDAARAIVCDVLAPGDAGPDLDAALRGADAIIDASASVAVARHLSDAAAGARRASVFLNPEGTASVLLAEDAARAARLDALEGQYYRLLLRASKLETHLASPTAGLRYTGACRQVTNRIPETSVAALTGLASRGLVAALSDGGGDIRVWTLDAEGAVRVSKAEARPAKRVAMADWTVVYDDGLLEVLRSARMASLPSETGGVLVGVVDVDRKTIVVVDALAAPSDSAGTEGGFERGTAGLLARLGPVQTATRDHVRYVGEWHSHPHGHDATPSRVDLAQIVGLCDELGREGIPPVMMIMGEHGEAVVSAFRYPAAAGWPHIREEQQA